MEREKNLNIQFAAIEKVVERNIPEYTESENRGKGYIQYGTDNQYPEYLWGLYNDVTTLKTIIKGTADFVAGDDAVCNVPEFDKEINKKGDTLFELIGWLAKDYLIYGGYAIQVIRNKAGNIGELYYIDFRYLRASKKRDLFYYSEEYSKKYARSNKTVVYPKFVPEAKDIAASIVYVSNEKSRTYPIPRYSGALKACEMERAIDEFHLSSLENGFYGSYLFNMCNGIPSDEQKAEIEDNITEKFAGASNAGRILLNFADSKDNAANVQKLEIQDFGEKYDAAYKRSREQIYCAFQAVPAIFGLMSESTGFNEEEFSQAFKLYNRTVVKPIQRSITDSFDKIFGVKGSTTITPFNLDTESQNNVE